MKLRFLVVLAGAVAGTTWMSLDQLGRLQRRWNERPVVRKTPKAFVPPPGPLIASPPEPDVKPLPPEMPRIPGLELPKSPPPSRNPR